MIKNISKENFKELTKESSNLWNKVKIGLITINNSEFVRGILKENDVHIDFEVDGSEALETNDKANYDILMECDIFGNEDLLIDEESDLIFVDGVKEVVSASLKYEYSLGPNVIVVS